MSSPYPEIQSVILEAVGPCGKDERGGVTWQLHYWVAVGIEKVLAGKDTKSLQDTSYNFKRKATGRAK